MYETTDRCCAVELTMKCYYCFDQWCRVVMAVAVERVVTIESNSYCASINKQFVDVDDDVCGRRQVNICLC